MTPASLRARLIRMLLLPIIGGILLVGGASCWSTYHEAAEVYDAEQVHFVKVLHMLAAQINESANIAIEGVPRGGAYEKYMAFRIWKQGNVFLQSENARDFGPVTQAEGFTDRMIGDVQWRFYVERQGDVIVEVAEESEVRIDLVRHILAGIFLPQLIILPIVGVIIWFGITRGLAPIERLSQLVRRRHVNELKPLCNKQIPPELLPMVDAINDLMARVGDAMRIEKNFTNYAAHEMRTPIAALKTQAQVILRTKEVEKQKELTHDLLATINRTQRIIEQLLAYARVQNEAGMLAAANLAEIARDEVRHAVPRALEKRITIETDLQEAAYVHVDETLIRLVIANLLDNAIKYVPESGHIQVQLSVNSGHAVLAIRDDGQGIASADAAHIFDPFYRVTGNDASGAGLGLAIVKWACDVQHIRIRHEHGLHGRGAGFVLEFQKSEDQ